MKNKFGFIPIVLPVLVMVLIIGLINLTGVTQTAQADTINANGPKLDSLTLTLVSPNSVINGDTIGGSGADFPLNRVPVPDPVDTGFDADTGDYTAAVPFGAIYVTVAATGANGATVAYSPSTDASTVTVDGTPDGTQLIPDHQVSLTVGATTTIRVTASANQASQTYVVEVKREKPEMPAPVVKEGPDQGGSDDATLNPMYSATVNAYKSDLEYSVATATIGTVLPETSAGDTRGQYRTITTVSADDDDDVEGNQLDLIPGQSRLATISYARQIFLGFIQKATTISDDSVAYSQVATKTETDQTTRYDYTLYPGSKADGWSQTSTRSYTIDFLRASPSLDAGGLSLYTSQVVVEQIDANKVSLDSDDHPASNYRGDADGDTYYVLLQDEDGDPLDEKVVTTTMPTYGTENTHYVMCDIVDDFGESEFGNLNENCRGEDGNSVYAPRANKDAFGFASLVTSYTAMVGYEVATVTLKYMLVSDPSDVTDSEKQLKVDLVSGETGDPDEEIHHHQVALKPGDNRIQVRVASPVTGNGLLYTINVMRAAPSLRMIQLVPVENGVDLGPLDVTIDNANSMLKSADDGSGFNSATTTYTLEVGHEVEAIKVAAQPTFGAAEFTKPMESSTMITPTVKALKVDLEQGDGNVIEIKAYDPNYSSAVKKYTITVTRKPTPLDGLALTAGGDSVALDPEFAMGTKTYEASVSYADDTVRVTPTVPSNIRDRATVTYFTPTYPNGATSTTDYMDEKLTVGDNKISVEVGIPNNTSTYMVTVDRMEPGPIVQFRLYDEDGDEITPPQGSRLPLELVSASRRYELNMDDGFSVDVHSVRMNVWLGDDVSAADVKVSVGRVSIPVDDTVRGFGGNDDYHTMGLAEGSNTIAFEVEFSQHPDDQSLSGRSVHTLTIDREGNSRPTFRPNHSLGQIVIEMVDQEPIDTSTTVMPHAVDGNDALEYTLEGKGGGDLPQGLSFMDPVGRDMDGWIYGEPNIRPASAYADHVLILSVEDDDDVTGASDEDSIEFTIRIFRDEEARRAARTPSDVGPAQLIDLGLYYADPANAANASSIAKTCKEQLMARPGSDQAGKDCGMLMPEYDPDTMAYSVMVPTDVDTVDIHAVATSSATLTLRGSGSSELGAGSGIHDEGDDKRHEWNGYRVLNGGAAPTDNIYIIKVTEGSDTNEYSVTIRRESDTQVTFAAADKTPLTYRFYYGISPDGSDDGSMKITLPAAMPGSGNGATSSWTYSLDRTDTGDEVDKKDFEGLVLDANRMLDGTPMLDTVVEGEDVRLSDRSGAPGVYSVKDADLNEAASDGDSITVDVTVYRDVTLTSYSVDGSPSGNLGLASREISSDWSAGEVSDDYSDWVYTWDATDDSGAMVVDAYTFPVSHTATVATIMVTARHDDAETDIKPDDADESVDGHQVELDRGDNIVTVTVTNGDVEATHKINLVRPGMQASDITVYKDRGKMASEPLGVKLTPTFDRDTYSYTAEVENWIQTLRIVAEAVDLTATVSVNLDAINTAVGFAEVRLNEPQGSEDSETTFRVGITNPTISDAPGLYILTVTRKGNTAPVFDMDQEDKTLKNGEAMDDLALPPAMGGNGEISHNLTAAELPNGLSYDAKTRTISGVPQLTTDQGFESDFVLTYTAVDQDSDTSASDSDSMTFTLTVTNGDVPTEPVDDGFGSDENYNTLRALVVSFQRSGQDEQIATLVPEFGPANGGPYTAIVPHDAENVWVTPSLSDAGAALWIDNISQQDARKVKILSTTSIMVEHTTHPALGSMTYTVELSPTDESAPSFAGKSIDDIVVLAGEEMRTVQLPAADGGNTDVQPLTYTLKDHGGRDIPRRGIGGIKFDAANRTLSGTPVLNADADKTIYNLSYQATDQDGDESEVVTFKITVCDPDQVSDCTATGPDPEPTPTMTAMLTEWRSNDGTMATLTWTPDTGAMNQAAFMVAAKAGVTAPMSMDDLDGSTYTLIDEDGAPTTSDYLIPAGAYMLEVTGLTAGTTYVYGVIAWDGTAWGAWELVNFGAQ